MDSQMPLLKHLTMLSPNERHLKNCNHVGGPKFWAKNATNKCGLNWAINMPLEGFNV